jgi:hypothetical protein
MKNNFAKLKQLAEIPKKFAKRIKHNFAKLQKQAEIHGNFYENSTNTIFRRNIVEQKTSLTGTELRELRGIKTSREEYIFKKLCCRQGLFVILFSRDIITGRI